MTQSSREKLNGPGSAQGQPVVDKGLVFLPPGTSPQRRRQTRTFCVLYALAGLAVLWPIYPFFGGIRPLIFGLPLSFVWPIGALFVVFFALLWLYLGERVTFLQEETKA